MVNINEPIEDARIYQSWYKYLDLQMMPSLIKLDIDV